MDGVVGARVLAHKKTCPPPSPGARQVNPRSQLPLVVLLPPLGRRLQPLDLRGAEHRQPLPLLLAGLAPEPHARPGRAGGVGVGVEDVQAWGGGARPPTPGPPPPDHSVRPCLEVVRQLVRVPPRGGELRGKQGGGTPKRRLPGSLQWLATTHHSYCIHIPSFSHHYFPSFLFPAIFVWVAFAVAFTLRQIDVLLRHMELMNEQTENNL